MARHAGGPHNGTAAAAATHKRRRRRQRRVRVHDVAHGVCVADVGADDVDSTPVGLHLTLDGCVHASRSTDEGERLDLPRGCGGARESQTEPTGSAGDETRRTQ